MNQKNKAFDNTIITQEAFEMANDCDKIFKLDWHWRFHGLLIADGIFPAN
jgi:hypothetical protein